MFHYSYRLSRLILLKKIVFKITMKSKKQYNETLLEIKPKTPVEHCISVLLKKTCQVFEVKTTLKKPHLYGNQIYELPREQNQI